MNQRLAWSADKILDNWLKAAHCLHAFALKWVQLCHFVHMLFRNYTTIPILPLHIFLSYPKKTLYFLRPDFWQMNRVTAPTRLLLIHFGSFEILPVWNRPKGKMQQRSDSSIDLGQSKWTTGVKMSLGYKLPSDRVRIRSRLRAWKSTAIFSHIFLLKLNHFISFLHFDWFNFGF